MNELKSGWSYKKLDELGFVGRGRSRNRPRNDPSLYGGPYPFFQTGDVKAADLYLREYSQTYNDKGLAQSKLWEPDTLLITIAANIAESAILGIKGCFPDSIVGFIADPEKSEVRFVKYALDTLKLQMQSISRGTTQDNLSLEKLLSIGIPVPPLPTQRKIAAILSAYDDLIENNTRRIALLEQMAQLLYREWFVRFRFPGHESARMVESALGEIPEGWCNVSFSELVMIQRDNINPGQYSEEVFWHYSIPAFDEAKMPVLETGGTILSNKYEIPDECILLSKLNPRIPRIWLPFPPEQHRAITSTEFLVLIPKSPINRFYLFSLCSSPEFTDTFAGLALGTSTSHQRVKPQDLLGLSILLPPSYLIEAFTNLVQPLLELAHKLRMKNITLHRTRDLLLPRLISGEMDVAGVEVAS